MMQDPGQRKNRPSPLRQKLSESAAAPKPAEHLGPAAASNRSTVPRLPSPSKSQPLAVAGPSGAFQPACTISARERCRAAAPSATARRQALPRTCSAGTAQAACTCVQRKTDAKIRSGPVAGRILKMVRAVRGQRSAASSSGSESPPEQLASWRWSALLGSVPAQAPQGSGGYRGAPVEGEAIGSDALRGRACQQARREASHHAGDEGPKLGH